MKYIVLLIMLLPVAVYSQRLEVDKIDEFSNERERQTSWEKVYEDFSGNVLRLKFLRIGERMYIAAKMIANRSTVYTIHEGSLLQIKTSAGKKFEFASESTVISSIGGGAVGLMASGVLGINARYRFSGAFSDDDDICLIRVNTSIGYHDFDISKGKSKKIMLLYKLVIQ